MYANAIMRGGWAGTYMRSPDGHPIIDQIAGGSGAVDHGGRQRHVLQDLAGDRHMPRRMDHGRCAADWWTSHPFSLDSLCGGQPWIDERSYGDDRHADGVALIARLEVANVSMLGRSDVVGVAASQGDVGVVPLPADLAQFDRGR